MKESVRNRPIHCINKTSRSQRRVACWLFFKPVKSMKGESQNTSTATPTSNCKSGGAKTAAFCTFCSFRSINLSNVWMCKNCRVPIAAKAGFSCILDVAVAANVAARWSDPKNRGPRSSSKVFQWTSLTTQWMLVTERLRKGERERSLWLAIFQA